MSDADANEPAGSPPDGVPGPCLTRRDFLLYSGGAVSLIALGTVPGLSGCGGDALLASYPRKRIAGLSEVTEGEPITFNYPTEAPHCASFLVKLGTRARGGIGSDEDIVAFNQLCTHMGGAVGGRYRHEFKAAGPCPLHLTTFDLTRHGMVIAGHATQSLPQVVLELDGNDIYATAVLGLIHGVHDNKLEVPS